MRITTTIVFRIIISFILLLSGIGKIISPFEAEKVLIIILNMNIVPNEFTRIIIYFISISELILMFCFLLFKNKYCPLLVLSLFVLFTFTLISLPIRGIYIPTCGCFGSIIPDGNLLSAIIKNVIFIIITFFYIIEYNKETIKP